MRVLSFARVKARFLFTSALLGSTLLLCPSAQAQMSPHGPMAPAGHDMNPAGPPQNRSFPDAGVPARSVVVEVKNETALPLAGATVELHSHFQSVAQGDQKTTISRVTDAQGRVTFTDLDPAIRFSYSVAVKREGALYDVPSFRLSDAGQRVLIHTFPSTHDLNQAFVGLRGFMFLRLRADELAVEVMYRVMNMGQTTWVPKNVRLTLPENAQAVDTGASVGDALFKKADNGVELLGSFPPGQKDLSFTFQLPNENEPVKSLAMTVPPHVAELRVLAEQIPGMTLEVGPSFEIAEPAEGPEGKTVLITRRVMKPGEGELSSIQIELGGLPVTGPGRWFALALAALLALVGLAIGLTGKARSTADLKEEKNAAKEALLSEMLLLKRALTEGEIGPRTFEQTRREIITALARLESAP